MKLHNQREIYRASKLLAIPGAIMLIARIAVSLTVSVGVILLVIAVIKDPAIFAQEFGNLIRIFLDAVSKKG